MSNVTVTHAKVSTIADDPAVAAQGGVVPSDWNAGHTISGMTELLSSIRDTVVIDMGNNNYTMTDAEAIASVKAVINGGSGKTLTWPTSASAYWSSSQELIGDFLANDITLALQSGGDTTTIKAATKVELLVIEGSGIYSKADNNLNYIIMGANVSGYTAKTTPVDADSFLIVDSEASNVAKKLTLANLKTSLESILGPFTFASGLYYPPLAYAAETTNAITSQTMYAVPFPVSKTTTFDRIGIEYTAAGSAGCVGRLGIYGDVGRKPGATVLLDAGTVAFDGTPGFVEKTISKQLTPGLYWLVVVEQVATGVTVRARSGSILALPQSTGATATNTCWTATGITGSLPSSPSWGLSGAIIPKIMIRAA